MLKEHQDRIKFLLTYDNSSEIRQMYEWASQIYDKEWNYTINRTDDQKNARKKAQEFKGERYKGKEIFILNYNFLTIRPQEPEQLVIKF